MTRFKLACTAAAAAIVFTSSAYAADMPLKAPPLVAPVAAWSGWYAGVNAGWAGQRNCSTLLPQGLWGNFAPDAAFLAGLGTGCADASGFIGGGQFGVNYQTGSMVWGLEADLSGLSTKSSRTSNGAFPVTVATGTITETSSTPWLATFRGRLGALVTPNTLLYATGGLAVAQVNANADIAYFELNGAPRAHATGSATQVTAGWTAGAGAEMKLGSNWSVKGEYLYVSLDPVSYNTAYDLIAGVNVWGNFNEKISVPTTLHLVRVGANYQFGGASGSNAYAAAAPVPAFTWTGAYAGLNVGGVWGGAKATDVNCCGNGPWNAVGDTFTAKTSGVVGGVQAGYNWQFSSIVTGIEADIGYLGFKGTKDSAIAPNDTFAVARGGLYGTLRGRLGLAWDRTLLYGTGGLIVANVGSSVDDPYFTLPFNSLFTGILFTDKTKVQAGWTAGGGIEFAMNDRWSVKGEYLYFDLGTKRVTGAAANIDPPGNLYGYDIRNTGSIGRIGFNAKL